MWVLARRRELLDVKAASDASIARDATVQKKGEEAGYRYIGETWFPSLAGALSSVPDAKPANSLQKPAVVPRSIS